MKSLSSLELHFMIEELKQLEGSRVDNIYQKGKEEFLIQLFKSNVGKKLLKIIVGKSFFIATMKEEMESNSGFCMLLRKYLEGAYLDSIAQVEPERIAKLTFSLKEGQQLQLYVELFGKGNVILCKDNVTIIDALNHQVFKDRKVEPKAEYKHPQLQYNIFSLDSEFLESMLSSSSKESLVKSLAIELGMGGVYSEEACASSISNKSAKPHEITKTEQQVLLKSINDLLSRKLDPIVMTEDGVVKDVLPFPLKSLQGKEQQQFSSFSEAIAYFNEHKSPDTTTSFDVRLEEIKRIIEQQEKNIQDLEKEEGEQRLKAELIYSNYVQLTALLTELKEISKKHSWQDIKEKLKGHTLIKDVHPKDKSITIEFPS
jgi:predicted ribosome quality control (RQC) complex YloA/Tae2 family protein